MAVMIRPLLMRLSRRPWRFLFPTLVFFFFVVTLSRSRTHTGPPGGKHKLKTKSYFPPLKNVRKNSLDVDYCENFPATVLENIQVVLKIGAGDAPKNKAHLSTVTSCISNLIVVSDHGEKLGNWHAIDVLAELPASYAVNNTDFQTYAEHKKAQNAGDTISSSREGWKLDRFKFLPMVDKAYELNPKAKWYVFLESDVYFFWDTLFRLLDQIDHTGMHYMGAPPPGKLDGQYAYGGSGFVLSQGLMKKLLPPKASGGFTKISHRYEAWIKENEHGDAVLGEAIFNATGTRLEALNPTFTGEELKHISIDKENWCVPLLSLHRMSNEDMEALWKWERTRPFTAKPFVYSNLLAYTHPHLKEKGSREFWDNLSEAPVPNERPAHRNAGSCGSECEKDPHCLQWSYSQTVCRFAHYIKLGNPVDEQNGGQGEFTSGWELRKMGEMGFKTDEEHDIHDTCEEAMWVIPEGAMKRRWVAS